MARVSLSSPRSSMPSGYIRPGSSRRNSLTTYTDSYNGYSRNTHPSSEHVQSTTTPAVRTGASRDSFNNAASRFHTSSSTYGSGSGRSYTPASKPPLYRMTRMPSPSPSRTTAARPLPKGPGPRDQYGSKISNTEARNSFRPSSRSHIHDSTTTTTTTTLRHAPMKADHSYSNGYTSGAVSGGAGCGGKSHSPANYSSTTSNISGSSHQSTPRLSREKRTNSITDLTSPRDSRGSLLTSRKYGSTTDIHANSHRLLSNDYNKESKYGASNDFATSRRSDAGKTKSYMSKTMLSGSDASDLPPSGAADVDVTAALPDITSRPSSATSRSPSIDRVSKNNTLNNNYNVSSTSTSTSSNTRRQKSSSPDLSNRGLVGLRNLGNTCFMNSIIQCLSHTPVLRKHLLSNAYMEDINTTTSSMKGALAKSFAKLMAMLWSKDSCSSVSPTDFKEKISKFAPRFIGYSQQDAQEFMVYLLEGLQEDLNRNKKKKKRVMDCNDGVVSTPAAELADQAWKNYMEVENSFIGDQFVGQLRSALTCTVCDYASNTFDIFMDLSLPIRKKGYSSTVTLDDCMRLYMTEETMDGDERPMCARCKKRQRCTKRLSIQNFPDCLIIHLKRFQQDSYYRSKLSTLVDYPLRDLDLTEYAAESCSRRQRHMYSLYAVSCHSGTPFGGHYYAYANTGTGIGGLWSEFNDQRVSSISSTRVSCSEGYVLFYKRQSSS